MRALASHQRGSCFFPFSSKINIFKFQFDLDYQSNTLSWASVSGDCANTPRVIDIYSPLLYSTLLYSTLLYSTLLYSTLLYSTLLYSTLHYSTVLYSTLLYSTLLYSTLLYTTLPYSTLLYSTFLPTYLLTYLSNLLCPALSLSLPTCQPLHLSPYSPTLPSLPPSFPSSPLPSLFSHGQFSIQAWMSFRHGTKQWAVNANTVTRDDN